MNSERFVKNNKYIKNVINLINNFLIIKDEIDKIIVILINLKFLSSLLL